MADDFTKGLNQTLGGLEKAMQALRGRLGELSAPDAEAIDQMMQGDDVTNLKNLIALREQLGGLPDQMRDADNAIKAMQKEKEKLNKLFK